MRPLKATEQYLCQVVLTSESVDETAKVTIQMKATGQYFPVVPVVLFVMLYYDLTCFSILSPWMKSLSVAIQMKPTGHCSKGRCKQLRATFSKNQAKFQFSGSN